MMKSLGTLETSFILLCSMFFITGASCEKKRDSPPVLSKEDVRYLINTNDVDCIQCPTLKPIDDRYEEMKTEDAHNFYCHSPAYEQKQRQRVAELEERLNQSHLPSN